MTKRKRKRRRRASSTGGASSPGARSRSGTARKQREPIVPWRDRLRTLLERLRAYAREHHADALAAEARAQAEAGQAATHPADVERALDDFITRAGSAGDGRSILRAFAEDLPEASGAERDELLRWEAGRRRGVFVLQRCHADRMDVWDPLEGAGLTLHLLDRLPGAKAAEAPRGTVLTAGYLPFAARVVAIGQVELFAGTEPLRLYREEVRQTGVAWHDPPAPAPLR